MIYTALLYMETPPSELPLVSDPEARERIVKTENKKLRTSRAAAYALFERAYSDIFEEPVPKLSFGSDGKPALKHTDIKLSVSHTDRLCAVAFSKNDVGVDVQAHTEMLGKERVLKRFVNESLQKLIEKAKTPEVDYLFYKIDSDGKIGKYKGAEEKTAAHAAGGGAASARLWSALEALLKCKRGFSHLPYAEELAVVANITTIHFEEAALSVAELPK